MAYVAAVDADEGGGCCGQERGVGEGDGCIARGRRRRTWEATTNADEDDDRSGQWWRSSGHRRGRHARARVAGQALATAAAAMDEDRGCGGCRCGRQDDVGPHRGGRGWRDGREGREQQPCARVAGQRWPWKTATAAAVEGCAEARALLALTLATSPTTSGCTYSREVN